MKLYSSILFAMKLFTYFILSLTISLIIWISYSFIKYFQSTFIPFPIAIFLTLLLFSILISFSILLYKSIFYGKFKSHDEISPNLQLKKEKKMNNIFFSLISSYRFFSRTILYYFYFLWYEYLGEYCISTFIFDYFHRGLGIKLGNNCHLNGILLDFDLISIGDRVILGEKSIIQPHTFEGLIMKFQDIIIDSDTIIGKNSIILLGVKIQENVRIGDFSLVMKGEILEKNTQWSGNPLEKIEE